MIQFQCSGLRASVCLKALFWCAGWLGAWFATASMAGTNTLTSLNLYGGDGWRVAFHPTDPSIVYAALNGGFYRSTNGGVSWQLVNDRVRSPRTFAFHASRPNQVHVPSQGVGILASDDAGATLTRVAFADVYTSPVGMTYSADGSVLYAPSNRRLNRSTDGGVSWSAGAEAPVSYIAYLVVDPTDANRLYVAGAPGEGAQSGDGGSTWQPWTPPNALYDLVIANTQPVRFWAATQDGVQFSDDRGLTWNTTATSASRTITVDPHDSKVIYSGAMLGVQRSVDNGAHWDYLAVTSPSRVNSLAVDPTDANHLLVASVAGVASSNDGGATWTRRNEGIDAQRIMRLLSSPASDRVYVSTGVDGVLAISGDERTLSPLDNETLRNVTGGQHVSLWKMTLQPGTPDRLMGEVNSHIAHSPTGGASWSVSTDPGFHSGIGAITFASADGSRVLVCTRSGLYRSLNGGGDWEPVNSIYSEIGILMSAPSNPSVVYWPARPAGAATDAFLRSTDAGETWTTHTFPTPQVLALAIDPHDERTLYASGNTQSLYKSTDGGQSWSELTIFPNEWFPIWDVIVDAQNPNIVYAGGGPRVARSVDAGATWQELTSNPSPSWNVVALAVDAQRPHRLYVGMDSHGLREISIQPDLELTGGGPATPTGYGTVVPYAYRMRNIGPFDATNARMRVQLPADSTNISASGPGVTCSVAGTVVTCTSPILRNGAVADIRVNATQPTSGNVAVAATLEVDQPDAVMTNNSVTSDVRIAEVADVSVRVGVPAQVTRGDALSYSVIVANAGPNSATSPAVSFQLASGLNVASVTTSAGTCTTTGNNVTCQLPTMASDGSVTIQIISTASNSAGSFSSTVAVSTSGVDLLATNNEATSTTTVNEPSRGGGGGGSNSLLMLAALALLARLRALSCVRGG